MYKVEKWKVEESGGLSGPLGPFWRVIAASDGRVIATQITDKEVAGRIARLPMLERMETALIEERRKSRIKWKGGIA